MTAEARTPDNVGIRSWRGGDRPWHLHGRHGEAHHVRDEPLYRADPERGWSMVGLAAYWADK